MTGDGLHYQFLFFLGGTVHDWVVHMVDAQEEGPRSFSRSNPNQEDISKPPEASC